MFTISITITDYSITISIYIQFHTKFRIIYITIITFIINLN